MAEDIMDRSMQASMEIKTISQDSISVRALQHADDTFWFAGSNGTYGMINDTTYIVESGLVNYNGNSNLEFRSIASTENYTYMLTAGSPALIYKIDKQDKSATLVYKEEGEKVFYDSMKFWFDREGIAMGDPQDGCLTILRTFNAGQDWIKVPCSDLPAIVEGEAAFAASNSNISIYRDHVWIVSGGAAARVYHSADRGETWTVTDSPIKSGGEMTGIYAVDFYDENTGVIIGGDWNDKDSSDANKAITHDGGKTWSLLNDSDGPGYCSDITFIPDTAGQELLAVGSPGIWWSGNQGDDWIKLSDQGFYTVAFENKQKGVLAGANHIAKFDIDRYWEK
ncbi:WD40/YVTN/BNR-like repeat-containing protein [Nonlabens ponticola]|nr:exo-alpha-sialidase [Nonlabens ponticola]